MKEPKKIFISQLLQDEKKHGVFFWNPFFSLAYESLKKKENPGLIDS